MKGKMFMKIMFLNGGLANQMFQYIFYRYGQLMNPGEEWYLDDSFFFVNDVHNGYELNRVFGLHPSLLSEYFDDDVWEYMIGLKKEGKSIPQILLENDVNIRMISEYDNWKKWNPFEGRIDELGSEFEDWMTGMKGDIYYNGYAININYFKKIESVIRSEFTFPEIEDEQNLGYLREIEESNSCAMHVRRGDFVNLNVAAPDDFYDQMVDEMLSREPDGTFFIFSDDISYCLEHRKEMGLNKPDRVIFVKGNEGEYAFRDMQLMSKCRNIMVGNSSFSFMASILNKNPKTTLTFRKDRFGV